MSTANTEIKAPERPAVAAQGSAPVRLPRVAIQFCTQCKWMLRAAYFAQELLSTFGGALGEVALQPATGGIFTVTIDTADAASSTGVGAPRLLWDRKAEGCFPETKELKRRVRDVIEPGRDLGHVDRNYGKAAKAEAGPAAAPVAQAAPAAAEDTDKAVPVCEDCQ